MTGKKVLLVPLNWGLGHATRLIPVIKILLNKGADVYIAGSPAHIALLTKEFVNLKILPLPYITIKLYNPKYQIFNLFWQMPAFLLQIIREHMALKKLADKQLIDIVISDNCYGLWNQKLHSIFITHQLNIKLPKRIQILEKPVNFINQYFIGKYNSCWVPDFEKGHSLAGELSNPLSVKSNVVYIGPLSRFLHDDSQIVVSPEIKKNQVLFIISGPETQRTRFENKIRTQINLLEKKYSCIVVRGLPENQDNKLPTGWYNHVPGNMLENLILQSEFIICRPGYSTVMDLTALKKMASLVPTPGQSEQEYLAKHLGNIGFFCWQDQEKLNLSWGISVLRKRQNNIIYPDYNTEPLEKVFDRPPFTD
jgi:predicted glycosyltransferase